MNNFQFITDDKYKKEWNQLALHPLQTWEWGEVKQASGNIIIRVGEFDGSKLTSVYLFTQHPIGFGKSVINYAKGVWPESTVLKFLQKHFGRQAILIKLEPETYIEESGRYRIPLAKQQWSSNGLQYALSRSPLFARHTFVVDLTLSEAELLANMKSKTRYNINLASRKGVVVRDETDNPNGFEHFFSLYQETVSRQNYLGHGKSYHQKVWSIMRQAGMARILVAYYQNEPLSSYLLFFFNNTAYYLYGGSSWRHKELMASNLLMWEAIRLAKRQHCQHFDMWGALAKHYSPEHPWAGFHRFKEGYGGIHYDYLPTIDVVLQPVFYRIFSFVWPIRIWALEKLLTLKKH